MSHGISLVCFYDIKEKMLLELVKNNAETELQLLAIASFGEDSPGQNLFIQNLKEFLQSKKYNKDVGMLIISQFLLQLNEASLEYIDQKISVIQDVNDQIHHMGVKFSQKIILS